MKASKPKPVKVAERDVVKSVLLAFKDGCDGVHLVRQNTGAFKIRSAGYKDEWHCRFKKLYTGAQPVLTRHVDFDKNMAFEGIDLDWYSLDRI